MKKFILIQFISLISFSIHAQEGLPVYSDYLTDNYYLVHPAMAGIGNSGKLRLTGRQQWFGVDNAPSLQTLSINSRIGESSTGLGFAAFNDKNGYTSQSGAFVTYAYHLLFSRNELDIDMLSFGLSAGFNQYRLDQTDFVNTILDDDISGDQLSAINPNFDLGLSYHYLDFYTHLTIKNILNNNGINVNDNGNISYNVRTLLFSLGHSFGRVGGDWFYEPSVMFMYKDKTGENALDLNFKVFREMNFGQFWGGLSLRKSLDSGDIPSATGALPENAAYISPFFGVDLNRFVVAYTYSHQMNDVNLNTAYHQITLGYNFNFSKGYYVGTKKYNRRR